MLTGGLGRTVALVTEEVLSSSLGGLALGRIGRMVGLVDCFGKTVALSTEEVLSFGLGRLGLSAWLGNTVALPTEQVLSFGLGCLALRRLGRLGLSA